MEVIVDTNILIDAIFDQLNCEDCWEILHLIRKKDITPIMSKGLLKEYIFIPSKVVINALIKTLNQKGFIDSVVEELMATLYDCYSDVCEMIINNSKIVNVSSRGKFCIEDPEDNKIINLAIDSDCPIIITKNDRHFECVYHKQIKTCTGKQIEIYNPNNFINMMRR
ncbi:putative toxin-antitoxin system toxin component, PIN family [Clostridium sp. MT-14]|jgi:putative PIN family toxin of toxin-antitoxin system|uniref:Toxin-antitoxin system toxin component, PIN family n=1 Tax=Clostridium aromativorans TaxID=2836848 RepID=A0ABS8NCI6_9CLOT|nr:MULTISPECIES: putative toxin-antitoxin system toxin component, PIN family [Clostridium]KAA8666933.1 putative toxin-antitoxin system toxin component, PIN family [Clostridium sp. HV4-5-A1G]MCC9296810.1 putative toxin-antitoxin system toxin component, PIN family [Clostridium aromativorans]CAB1249570.1 putative toxin-antitoxin system toxin component, PIN family [Clostridiaceae bacterium BL-3]